MSRDIQIDIAKGLAIFTVVAGHIIPGITSQIIFLFHMPFFFIVSGYLHKIDAQEGRYFRNKAISLLLPYFVYLLAFATPSVTSLLSELLRYPSEDTILSFLKYVCKLIYGGELLKEVFGVFWFVTCLFLTQQLFNFIRIRFVNTKVVMSIAVILYVVSFLNQISPKHLIFPWAANVVCCSFLFYSIGSVHGKYIFKNQDKAFVFPAIAISAFSLVLVALGFGVNFNMKYTYYGIFIISPLVAISFTKVLMSLANLISKSDLLASIIVFAGQASITIMFSHQFLHFQLSELCDRWPWPMTFTIFTFCCILHWLFLKKSYSRALFLGSRKDIELLITPYHWTKI